MTRITIAVWRNFLRMIRMRTERVVLWSGLRCMKCLIWWICKRICCVGFMCMVLKSCLLFSNGVSCRFRRVSTLFSKRNSVRVRWWFFVLVFCKVWIILFMSVKCLFWCWFVSWCSRLKRLCAFWAIIFKLSVTRASVVFSFAKIFVFFKLVCMLLLVFWVGCMICFVDVCWRVILLRFLFLMKLMKCFFAVLRIKFTIFLFCFRWRCKLVFFLWCFCWKCLRLCVSLWLSWCVFWLSVMSLFLKVLSSFTLTSIRNNGSWIRCAICMRCLWLCSLLFLLIFVVRLIGLWIICEFVILLFLLCMVIWIKIFVTLLCASFVLVFFACWLLLIYLFVVLMFSKFFWLLIMICLCNLKIIFIVLVVLVVLVVRVFLLILLSSKTNVFFKIFNVFIKRLLRNFFLMLLILFKV